MWRELTTLWQSVRDPDYAHLLLESVPLFGLGFGLVILIIAYISKESKSRLAALALICLSCASIWPYLDLRVKATPRIIATRDPSFSPLITKQTERRSQTAWVYYVMTGVSGLTLLLGFTRYGKWLILATVVLGAGAFWVSLWLHKKECEVYHRNIVRYTPPS